MLNFLQLVMTPPEDSVLYLGSYDFVLVSLSVIIAMFASYAALLVSQIVSDSIKGWTKKMWLAGGGLCLGVGIWSMHFVGILAFNLPCSTSYDSSITFLSTIPGILASILALKIISRHAITRAQLALGGVLIGAGIGAMHYSGMAAMRLNGLIRYDIKLFILSIFVAVILATIALWIKFRLQALKTRWRNWATPASAMVMGLAVSGMHYTAMAAAYFIRGNGTNVAESGISPTLLAAIVLAMTSSIIVVTIAASYLGKSQSLEVRQSYRLISILLVGWGLIAWLSTDYYYNHQANKLYRQESLAARQQIEQLARNIEESLKQVKNIPRMLSHDEEILNALLRFGANVAPAISDREKLKQRWTQDRLFSDLNSLLKVAQIDLDVDMIFVVNAAGDCIASGNALDANSPIGINYADRDYFRQAIAGQQGHQYLVSRTTGIPGLYYSSPVFIKGTFIGAVVVKRDISKLSYWTAPINAFITDANGVIILSENENLKYRTLPNSAIENIPEEKRLLLYKRSDLRMLPITPWGIRRFPLIVRFANSDVPTILTTQKLPESSIIVHIPRQLDELARFDSEKIWLFLMIGISGGLLIVAASAVVLYLRESQRSKADLRIAATAFEAQEGMFITDANNEIVRVNRAFTTITGFELDDVVGKNPRILSSGRHNTGFFADMWASITSVGSWSGEIWNRRKNGEIYPEFLTITAVKDASGAITNFVGTFNDITASKVAEDEIRNLAFYDPLTGLPNRRLLIDRLHQALASCSRNQQEGAMLYIDLDNFKTLNDRLGHSTGDLLLKQVAQRLRTCVREGDTVARFEGDEFVVILEELSGQELQAATQAEVVGQKILDSLNQIYQLGAYEYRSTPSIGITLFNSQHQATEDLMKQADIAMYQAKSSGRNSMRFFDPMMQESINSRAALEEALHAGIEKKEFRLYYQIQMDVLHRPLGAEVLIRWIHPELGFVSPAQFIPLAEETGLMIPIGLWVLETACAQLKVWQQNARTRELVLSVNVSAKQFKQADFASQVQSTIQRFEVDPTRLKIELTESMLVQNIEETICTMSTLKAIGVQFSLDDFGTGYSSLQYLKRLPLDQLKIDQSFVREIVIDANDRAIIRTIIAMADNLNLDIIAEGVESEEQRQLLLTAGCKNFQGYLFSKPVPVEQFELLLGNG